MEQTCFCPNLGHELKLQSCKTSFSFSSLKRVIFPNSLKHMKTTGGLSTPAALDKAIVADWWNNVKHDD